MKKQLPRYNSSSKLYSIQKEIYKKSFYEFFKDAFHVCAPQDILVDNWHVKYLCDLLQKEAYRVANNLPKEHNYCINIPPRSTKTKICSVVFPIWCWINYPGMRFLTFSFNKDRANENAKESRDLIEDDWFKHYFPEVVIKSNNVEKLSNTDKGYRHAYGLSGFTGDGGDILIVDDPQDPDMAESKKERDNVINFYRTLSSRDNNANVGLTIIIQQRLHRNDLTGFLKENVPEGSFKFIHLPAILDKHVAREHAVYYTDGLLDPIRLSHKILDMKKSGAALGLRGYTAQYLQNPASSDAGIIKEDWITGDQIITKKEFYEKVKDKVLQWDFFLDTAYGKSESDFTAILCATVFENNLYIKYVEQNRKSFPDLIKHLIDLVEKMGSYQSRVFVEPTAAGVPLIQQMKVTTSLNMIEGKYPAKSKLERVIAVTNQMQGLRVFLIQDSWNKELTDQCTSFTGEDGNTDDLVDTLQMAINKLLVHANVTRFNYS